MKVKLRLKMLSVNYFENIAFFKFKIRMEVKFFEHLFGWFRVNNCGGLVRWLNSFSTFFTSVPTFKKSDILHRV